MGTLPNETRGVPYEESVISAGEIFLGASGVLHEVLTLEPSFALSANYFPFTSALFDAAYHGHEWQLEPSPPHPNRVTLPLLPTLTLTPTLSLVVPSSDPALTPRPEAPTLTPTTGMRHWRTCSSQEVPRSRRWTVTG